MIMPMLSRKAFATFVWDVWFDGQIVCSKIEHLSNIDEILHVKTKVHQNKNATLKRISTLASDPP